VTDLNTGLQWEKKDNLDGVVNDADPHDADNIYSLSASGTAADGTAYTDFLSKLNNGAFTGCFANHCDWRLPSHVELEGIVDETKGVCSGGSGACIDPAFGPTQLLYYWYYWSAATTRRRRPDPTPGLVFFGVRHEDGANMDGANKVIGAYARAVRNAQ
jgi:hypothetical protein